MLDNQQFPEAVAAVIAFIQYSPKLVRENPAVGLAKALTQQKLVEVSALYMVTRIKQTLINASSSRDRLRWEVNSIVLLLLAIMHLITFINHTDLSFNLGAGTNSMRQTLCCMMTITTSFNKYMDFWGKDNTNRNEIVAEIDVFDPKDRTLNLERLSITKYDVEKGMLTILKKM